MNARIEKKPDTKSKQYLRKVNKIEPTNGSFDELPPSNELTNAIHTRNNIGMRATQMTQPESADGVILNSFIKSSDPGNLSFVDHDKFGHRDSITGQDNALAINKSL